MFSLMINWSPQSLEEEFFRSSRLVSSILSWGHLFHLTSSDQSWGSEIKENEWSMMHCLFCMLCVAMLRIHIKGTVVDVYVYILTYMERKFTKDSTEQINQSASGKKWMFATSGSRRTSFLSQSDACNKLTTQPTPSFPPLINTNDMNSFLNDENPTFHIPFSTFISCSAKVRWYCLA